MRRKLLFIIAGLLALLPVSAQENVTLTVFTAASLTDAFEEIATEFEAANAGVDVIYNFGGSSALATQLAEGAPADVFASANARQMTAAADAGRIAGSPRTFVKNRLVLIVPADNPAGITTLRDLANPGVKLVVAAEGVPVRDYTDTMLALMAADPGYGEDYSAAVMRNVVSEEDNVRQVSAKVALGEADAGLVYISDVTPDINDQVLIIAVPDTLNTIATYPIAATNDTAHLEIAQAYIDYVLSDEAQDILVKWNFISVRIPAVADVINIPADGSTTVDGQVLNPYTLTVDMLQSEFTSQSIDVTYLSGEETVSTSYTGVPLWQVISAAQPNFNADMPGDAQSMYIVVTARDEFQAVIAWGEIDSDFGAQPILVAYAENGEPIGDSQGALRLIVPGDKRGGRYISGVVNISLRDAPKPGN